MTRRVSLQGIVPDCDTTAPLQLICRRRKGGEAWQLQGNYPLEQCQDAGVESDRVGEDRCAYRPTDNCSVFVSGFNGDLEGNA